MIKMAHLAKDLMNLYGDNANMRILSDSISTQKIPFQTIYIEKDTDFNPNDYDFIYIGAGTEKSNLAMIDWLMPLRDSLTEYIESGKILFCTDFYIFGKNGLNIFDFEYNMLSNNRISKDILINDIVGYINTGVSISNITTPLFIDDNNSLGFNYKNFFGTGIIGPIFLKNPMFLRKILKLIMPDFNFEYLDDELLILAHNHCIKRLSENKKT